MEELASELLKELNCDTAFSIKLPAGLPLIGGVQLDIAESVVITWVVMAVILILSIILTSNLKVHNVSRRQLVAETIVTKLEGIVTGMIGEEGNRYLRIRYRYPDHSVHGITIRSRKRHRQASNACICKLFCDDLR